MPFSSWISRGTGLVLIGFLFLLSRLAGAATTDPSLRWKTVKTKHFNIHYYPGEEEVVQKLVPLAEEVHQELSPEFTTKLWGRTEIVVMDHHDVANGFASVIPYNMIVLRVVPPDADSILADYDEWLRELFVHEYTHILHLNNVGYPARLLRLLFGTLVAPNGLEPGWIVEGIATYYETEKTSRGRGRSSFTDMLLRTDILKKQFLPIDQMAGSHYEWPAWRAQYLYGVAFWRYLSEKYGEDKIREYSRRYGSSLRFFMLNSHAKKVFEKKTFYQLWREWKATLEERYQSIAQELTQKGLQEGEVFLSPRKGESFSQPIFSRDGWQLAYVATSIHHPIELRLRDLETGREKILLKKKEIQQMSFSPQGDKIFLSYAASYKRYYQFSDLYEIDLKTKKRRQLTKGKRLRDPDSSPNGKSLVAVLQKTGASELVLFDLDKKSYEPLFQADQIDHPRWVGEKTVVFSAHREETKDLWLLDVHTREVKKLTRSMAMEDRPVVDEKRGLIYFSSDEDGIPNIYSYSMQDGQIHRTSRVLSGAFAPAVSPEGALLYQYYTGRGFEIRRIPVIARSPAERDDEAISLGQFAGERSPRFARDDQYFSAKASAEPEIEKAISSKSYNPFPKFIVPRYLFPGFAFVDQSFFFSASVGGYDPLLRHSWFADINYRTDNDFVGYDVGYAYSRFRPSFFTGWSHFSVNYGDVFGFGNDFFEERKRAYGGLKVPFKSHSLTGQYFFEDRSEQSGLPPGTTLSTLGRYAGFNARYSYGKTEGTAAQISPEGGQRVSVSFEVTDDALGSSSELEQKVVWGDLRQYIRLPYSSHHVLALRAAGGIAFGDRLLQGNFGLGGSLGESPFLASSTRLFTLRGLPLVTFSRDRVWVASAEYRLPLFRVQRGLGTLPIALNSAHFAAFTDVGDAMTRTNPSFRPLLGVGAELRGDFVVGYHIPVTGRLGYGVILTNRDRIAGATDSLTGADARNGVVILELGTSF